MKTMKVEAGLNGSSPEICEKAFRSWYRGLASWVRFAVLLIYQRMTRCNIANTPIVVSNPNVMYGEISFRFTKYLSTSIKTIEQKHPEITIFNSLLFSLINKFDGSAMIDLLPRSFDQIPLAYTSC